MKNVTITIDDATHQAARVYAAQRGSSISALVRDHLVSLVAAGATARDGVREMQASFTSAPSQPVAGLFALLPESGADDGPWVVAGKTVWTKGGKPRQPGALRGIAVPPSDDMAALPTAMLASFADWDEDRFDDLP